MKQPPPLKPFPLPPASQPGSYDNIDPLDGRYFDAETARYLSEGARVTTQAYVEAALAHTLADFGITSRQNARAIEQAARKVTAAMAYEEEKHTKHDIKALANCIKRSAGEQAAPYVHFGATSYDIISTASALQMRAALQHVVVPRLKRLLLTLASLSERYADTIQIGRTHGQHALPVTFGFAMSEYVARLGENIQALEALAGELKGKFSGAVGGYNALSLFVDDPLAFERSVLARVGLAPAPYSTQIVPPEGMVRLIDELVISAEIAANLAHDMRHLQRTEIAEVRERFEPGQTGSSTMAHKRNPKNFENVIGMSKQVIAQSVNANLNLTSEHQRDLTDSASARFYTVVPATVAAMAKRLDMIMGKLEVDEPAMARNLTASGGAIAAEPLYLLLAKHGHPQAHETAKRLAHHALEHGQPLAEAARQDPETAVYWQRFAKHEQAVILNPERTYTGLCSKKAKTIARQWRQIITKGGT